MVRSAAASSRAVGRSGAAWSPFIASATPRASMMSPVTVIVTGRGGRTPSTSSGYSAGVRSGSAPSTVITVTRGSTASARTTPMALGSRATCRTTLSAEPPDRWRTRPAVPSMSSQRATAPSRSLPASRAETSIDPLEGCTTRARGIRARTPDVEGAGATADGVVGRSPTRVGSVHPTSSPTAMTAGQMVRSRCLTRPAWQGSVRTGHLSQGRIAVRAVAEADTCALPVTPSVAVLATGRS